MPYKFETDRLIIRTSEPFITEMVLDYYTENRRFFEKYEPAFTDRYYTFEIQEQFMKKEEESIDKLSSIYYYFSLKDDPEKIIGSISFVRIRPEPYANVIMGYNLDEQHQGHGYCTEACKATMDHVLSLAPIHRIESRVMTDNEKSIRVLERLGFSCEGTEKASILIAGSFRDHLRYAFINENYKKNSLL